MHGFSIEPTEGGYSLSGNRAMQTGESLMVLISSPQYISGRREGTKIVISSSYDHLSLEEPKIFLKTEFIPPLNEESILPTACALAKVALKHRRNI